MSIPTTSMISAHTKMTTPPTMPMKAWAIVRMMGSITMKGIVPDTTTRMCRSLQASVAPNRASAITEACLCPISTTCEAGSSAPKGKGFRMGAGFRTIRKATRLRVGMVIRRGPGRYMPLGALRMRATSAGSRLLRLPHTTMPNASRVPSRRGIPLCSIWHVPGPM